MTRSRPPLITLTTDFGVSDTYVGVMKGVILGISPHARLIDLTHDIGPQNLLEASARLEAAVPYFPPGAIHLVVVDPGVGSERAAIIVQTEKSLFVAPDNGVLTLPLRAQPPIDAIKLTEAAHPFFLFPVSATFHGRDVFAPIAAHLAGGLPPGRFGLRCLPTDLVTLSIPLVEVHQASAGLEMRAPILYIDRFGNLITALRRDDWPGPESTGHTGVTSGEAIEVAVGAWHWRGVVAAFASVAPDAPLAYWGSAGRLEVAVRNGSAARSMGVVAGDIVSLCWRP